MFFGESAADQNYHLPERLSPLALRYRSPAGGAPTLVELKKLETDAFVGLRSPAALAPHGLLETSCRYGVYHGTLLTYYAKHYLGSDPQQWSKFEPSSENRLDVVPAMLAGEKMLELTVYVDKKPFGGADVSRLVPEAPSQKQITDAKGTVRFPAADGPLSFLVSVAEKEASGQLAGEAYAGCSNYMTLTLSTPAQHAARAEADVPASSSSSTGPLPALPEPISSFGAAVTEGYLYVYGGHTGEAHDHSCENLSRRFLRLPLVGSGAWEELPCETPLQGLALVAQGGAVYRVGGMLARNGPQQDDDLHSVSDVARYDPATRTWTSLPALPSGRSSHDALFIGDKLYVVGGWTLAGDGVGEWLSQPLVMDVAQKTLEWQQLPRQPFERRALAAGELDGRLVVIGGIDSDGDVSRRVDVYDPVTRAWSLAHELPGRGMNGFGVAAWNLDGRLYASGSNGVVYRLNSVDGEWEAVAQLKQARFFHRLLPACNSEQSLLAIAGACESGHLSDVEIVHVAGASVR